MIGFLIIFIGSWRRRHLSKFRTVDYEKFGKNRHVEENYINEEASIVKGYKFAFDEALLLIPSGQVEREIFDAENSW